MGSFHFDVFVKDVIIVVGLGILVFLCSVIKKAKPTPVMTSPTKTQNFSFF